MGGHAAWKKRVAAGELMKGSGGAALRHHPRLGRKGIEQLKLNRLGNLGGHGNPKKKKKNKMKQNNKMDNEKKNNNDTDCCITKKDDSFGTNKDVLASSLLSSFFPKHVQ